MRVHPGSGKQSAGVPASQVQRRKAAGLAGPGDDHLHDAGILRPFKHFGTIFIERIVCQVAADIDQFHEFIGAVAPFQPRRIVLETGNPQAIACTKSCRVQNIRLLKPGTHDDCKLECLLAADAF